MLEATTKAWEAPGSPSTPLHDGPPPPTPSNGSVRAPTTKDTTANTPPASSPHLNLDNKLVKRKTALEYSSEYVFLAVAFDTTTFKIAWIVMFLLRLWCMLFLAWSARLYWFVAHPYMEYYASLLGPSAVANFKPMGVCFGLLAMLHGYQLFKMMLATFTYGTLAMGPPPRSLGPDGGAKCFRGWRGSSPRHLIKAMRRDVTRLFFDRHGPFGVENHYFFLRMLVNEVIEIASQTTQVRKASILLSKAWINNLYVVMTVFNAWSTPLLRFLFTRGRAKNTSTTSAASAAIERLTCLATDFVLDAATGMVIPMILFVPYYQMFDFDAYNFEAAYLYDDIWFASMVTENQQLFALTQWDFVFKMIPHISIYSSLNAIRALVRQPNPFASARVHTALPDLTPKADSDNDSVSKPNDKQKPPSVRAIPEGVVAQLPYPSVHEELANRTAIEDIVRPDSKSYTLVQRSLGISLFLMGVAVLAFHLIATWTAQSTHLNSCATMSRPWFAERASCNVVRFNCHMNNVTTATNDNLDTINPDSVLALVFSHCPELRVPPKIRDFHNLLGIDMYNCTLVEWTVDAAVTPDAHPRIMYITFARTNMTRLPDGILEPLPDTMMDFEIAVSNLTELPSDLHERWHPMSVFYIEHAQLKVFPKVLQQLSVNEVSLLGNQITTLPELDPEATAFYSLTLSRNPLIRLPESIGDTANLGFLRLGNTQLTELPAWVDKLAVTATRIFIYNTPFCNARSEAELIDNYGRDAVLTCDSTSDDGRDGLYPLTIMAPRRLYDEVAATSMRD